MVRVPEIPFLLEEELAQARDGFLQAPAQVRPDPVGEVRQAVEVRGDVEVGVLVGGQVEGDGGQIYIGRGVEGQLFEVRVEKRRKRIRIKIRSKSRKRRRSRSPITRRSAPARRRS
jgi:hypothetical protein